MLRTRKRKTIGDQYQIELPSQDGKTKTKTRTLKGVRNKLQAQTIYKALKDKLGIDKTAHNSIGDIIAKYLKSAEIQVQSKRTVDEKKRIFTRSILPFFQNDFPDLLTPLRLEDYRQHRLAESPTAYRMINTEFIYLSSVIRWGVSMGYCLNEMPKWKKLPYRRPAIKYYSPEEIMTIINAMPFKHKCLFMCLYMAGLRSEEARFLKWSDVTFYGDNPSIRVIGKGNKYRDVPMNEVLKASLWQLKELCLSETWCFPSEGRFDHKVSDKPMGDCKWPLQKACALLKIESKSIHPHSFRHMFATHLLQCGVGQKTVALLMGHEQESTTGIYLHPQISDCMTAVRKIG